MNQDALADYLKTAAQTPAQLGGMDCVRFAVEALYVGWGRDFRDFLGYTTRRGAIDRLREAGGLEQAFTAEFGEPFSGGELFSGDFAFYDDPAIGLVMPGYVAVKYRRTILRVPLHFHRKGWRTWVPSSRS